MKKRLKPAQIREMNRKFWIVVGIGIVVLALLTFLDHYLTVRFVTPR